MAAIEFKIGTNKFELRSEESDDHLREVMELVKKKIERLRKSAPELTLQKAALLAACDLASQVIKGKKRAHQYQSQVLQKANEIFQKVESEISAHSA